MAFNISRCHARTGPSDAPVLPALAQEWIQLRVYLTHKSMCSVITNHSHSHDLLLLQVPIKGLSRELKLSEFLLILQKLASYGHLFTIKERDIFRFPKPCFSSYKLINSGHQLVIFQDVETQRPSITETQQNSIDIRVL